MYSYIQIDYDLFKINQVLNLQKNKKFHQTFIKLSVIIAIIWLLLSPSFTLANVIICVIVSLISSLIFTLMLHQNISSKMLEILTMKCFFQKDFYLYIKFITKEIVLSSIHILHTALTLKNFEDEIIQITLPKNISTYQTLLVIISITITPGTSVINVEKNKLTVHCLTKSIKNSLEEMTFVHKVLSFKF